jgi:hypothetical protein
MDQARVKKIQILIQARITGTAVFFLLEKLILVSHCTKR